MNFKFLFTWKSTFSFFCICYALFIQATQPTREQMTMAEGKIQFIKAAMDSAEFKHGLQAVQKETLGSFMANKYNTRTITTKLLGNIDIGKLREAAQVLEQLPDVIYVGGRILQDMRVINAFRALSPATQKEFSRCAHIILEPHNQWFCSACGRATPRFRRPDTCSHCIATESHMPPTDAELKAAATPTTWTCACGQKNDITLYACASCHKERPEGPFAPFANVSGRRCGDIANIQLILSALDPKGATQLLCNGDPIEQKFGQLFFEQDPLVRTALATLIVKASIIQQGGVPTYTLKNLQSFISMHTNLDRYVEFIYMGAAAEPKQALKQEDLPTPEPLPQDFVVALGHTKLTGLSVNPGGHFQALIKGAPPIQWGLIDESDRTTTIQTIADPKLTYKGNFTTISLPELGPNVAAEVQEAICKKEQ
jgi:hypothetical protein